jgi:hypothetical protein
MADSRLAVPEDFRDILRLLNSFNIRLFWHLFQLIFLAWCGTKRRYEHHGGMLASILPCALYEQLHHPHLRINNVEVNFGDYDPLAANADAWKAKRAAYTLYTAALKDIHQL